MTVLDDLKQYPKANRYLRRKWLNDFDKVDRRDLPFEQFVERLQPTGCENIALMDEVLRFAVAERAMNGGRFKMNNWFDGRMDRLVDPGYPPCGTSACLAGTAAVLMLEEPRTVSWLREKGYDKGKEALGLNTSQAFLLFHMLGARMPTIVEVASFMVGKDLRRD